MTWLQSLSDLATAVAEHVDEDDGAKLYSTVDGTQNRWFGLLSWDDLSTILSNHRIESPLLRLALAGQIIPAESYCDTVITRRKKILQQIDAPKLYGELAKGATLIVDHLDDIWEPARAAVMLLERVTRRKVGVNVYASWSQVEGFSPHWDDHDVLALQLQGTKRWEIFGESRRNPLVRDVEETITCPGVGPKIYTLRAGDALFLPRGWWHAAHAEDGPSLHATFSLWSLTGFDFLRWVVDRTASEELIRQNVPVFASSMYREKWASEITRIVLDSLTEPALLTTFLNQAGGSAAPHRGIALPKVGSWQRFAEGQGETAILWLCPQARINRHIDESGETATELLADGCRYIYPLAVEPLLRHLISQGCCTYDDIAKTVGEVGKESTVNFIIELAENGLVQLRGSGDVQCYNGGQGG